LEDLMRRFTQLMSESVTNAEARAQGLTQGLAQSVEEAAVEATHRFASATEEMRSTAASLREDLAVTRTELKKNVMELPDETKESAQAMRRVVSDQIKALKDLSDIVARTSRTQDAAASNAPSPIARAMASAPAAPTPVEPARAIPEPVAAAPAPTPVPTPPPAPAAVAQPEAPAAVEKAPVAAPAPRANPRPAMPLRKPEPTGLRGGLDFTADERTDASGNRDTSWVSDLLRRASQDEEGAPTPPRGRQGTDSLNTLSADIASSIDHDAAVNLWDRYQRGERNVFSRDIYTAQGRDTFDDISAKYRTDARFKESVDRYVNDFERLIADVAKNDRDNIMTQTYLTSDTGKVYTMLAHAAGRFA
jgi:hypothetical protein